MTLPVEMRLRSFVQNITGWGDLYRYKAMMMLAIEEIERLKRGEEENAAEYSCEICGGSGAKIFWPMSDQHTVCRDCVYTWRECGCDTAEKILAHRGLMSQ